MRGWSQKKTKKNLGLKVLVFMLSCRVLPCLNRIQSALTSYERLRKVLPLLEGVLSEPL